MSKRKSPGRPKLTPTDIFRMRAYGADGKPRPLDGPPKPEDYRVRLLTETRKKWMALRAQNPGVDPETLYDRATEQALAELMARVHGKRPLFARRRGRPPGAAGPLGIDDATLCREYKEVRPSIRTPGAAYSAVARQLWLRKYKATGISLHALRVRLSRACKKLNSKSPQKSR
jgi:hypothetical protein